MFRTTNPIQTPTKKFRMDWKETVAQVTTGLLLGALGVIAVNIATDGPTSPSDAVTPACATDGSEATSESASSNRTTNCFWDADSQGNGTGESFYVDEAGQVYYLSASDDCEQNLKAWTRDASQLIEDMDSRWGSSAPYSASVRTDNIDPLISRLDYIVNEVCK